MFNRHAFALKTKNRILRLIIKDALTIPPEQSETIVSPTLFDASIVLCLPDHRPAECADTKRALSASESELDHANDQRAKLESDLASMHAMCASLDAQV